MGIKFKSYNSQFIKNSQFSLLMDSILHICPCANIYLLAHGQICPYQYSQGFLYHLDTYVEWCKVWVTWHTHSQLSSNKGSALSFSFCAHSKRGLFAVQCHAFHIFVLFVDDFAV